MEKIYIDEINTIDRLIDRSKDTNIIYLTEDTILNTKAVQKIANRLEQLERERDYYFKQYQYHLKQNESLTREFSNSIPKSVIREKIDELNNQYRDYNERWEKSGMNKEHPFYKYLIRIEAEIDILEELLGGSNGI